MSGAERWRFFHRYAAGLALLVVVYLLVTILRSLRADFAPEIWSGIEDTVSPAVFARSELVVGAGILMLNGSVVFIRDNRRAFFTALFLAGCGPLVMGAALAGLRAEAISPFAFMVLLGIGTYLPYIAVHTTVFERLIAMTRDRGNIGYLMYLADSFGYLGYVAVLVVRQVLSSTGLFLPFFLTTSWVIATACLVLLVPCWWYFATHAATQPNRRPQPHPSQEGKPA